MKNDFLFTSNIWPETGERYPHIVNACCIEKEYNELWSMEDIDSFIKSFGKPKDWDRTEPHLSSPFHLYELTQKFPNDFKSLEPLQFTFGSNIVEWDECCGKVMVCHIDENGKDGINISGDLNFIPFSRFEDRTDEWYKKQMSEIE